MFLEPKKTKRKAKRERNQPEDEPTRAPETNQPSFSEEGERSREE